MPLAVDPGAGSFWGDRMHDTAGGLAAANAVRTGLHSTRGANAGKWNKDHCVKRKLGGGSAAGRASAKQSETGNGKGQYGPAAWAAVCEGLKLNAVWTRWQSPVALLHAVPHWAPQYQCLVIAHHDDRPVPSQSIGTSRPPASSDCCDLQAERSGVPNPHWSSAPRPRHWRQLVYVRTYSPAGLAVGSSHSLC